MDREYNHRGNRGQEGVASKTRDERCEIRANRGFTRYVLVRTVGFYGDSRIINRFYSLFFQQLSKGQCMLAVLASVIVCFFSYGNLAYAEALPALLPLGKPRCCVISFTPPPPRAARSSLCIGGRGQGVVGACSIGSRGHGVVGASSIGSRGQGVISVCTVAPGNLVCSVIICSGTSRPAAPAPKIRSVVIETICLVRIAVVILTTSPTWIRCVDRRRVAIPLVVNWGRRPAWWYGDTFSIVLVCKRHWVLVGVATGWLQPNALPVVVTWLLVRGIRNRCTVASTGIGRIHRVGHCRRLLLCPFREDPCLLACLRTGEIYSNDD